MEALKATARRVREFEHHEYDTRHVTDMTRYYLILYVGLTRYFENKKTTETDISTVIDCFNILGHVNQEAADDVLSWDGPLAGQE